VCFSSEEFIILLFSYTVEMKVTAVGCGEHDVVVVVVNKSKGFLGGP
jgi:hypothetical protein